MCFIWLVKCFTHATHVLDAIRDGSSMIRQSNFLLFDPKPIDFKLIFYCELLIIRKNTPEEMVSFFSDQKKQKRTFQCVLIWFQLRNYYIIPVCLFTCFVFFVSKTYLTKIILLHQLTVNIKEKNLDGKLTTFKTKTNVLQ